MSNDKISITEWLAKDKAGEFDKPDVNSMCDAGWWDWFCQDKSLFPRLQKLRGLLKVLAACPLIDNDKHYWFFKNNSPMCGKSYDSISICELGGDQDVVWWMAPNCTHTGEAEVILAPDFSFNVLDSRNGLTAIKQFFKNLDQEQLDEIEAARIDREATKNDPKNV